MADFRIWLTQSVSKLIRFRNLSQQSCELNLKTGLFISRGVEKLQNTKLVSFRFSKFAVKEAPNSLLLVSQFSKNSLFAHQQGEQNFQITYFCSHIRKTSSFLEVSHCKHAADHLMRPNILNGHTWKTIRPTICSSATQPTEVLRLSIDTLR